MSFAQFMEMAGYLLNIIGIVTCLAGLTLTRRPSRRTLGYLIAGLGFLIAASPLLAQLFGLVPPPAPVTTLPPG
ncbi:hypothetical protein ACPF7Z_12145 [Halomonas sp. GXIMD04776]|uniref:hypothetical protein n=1 Tax=Halomonas sp. GXIMD04776 TaxID=3415605 RepID=UPI003CBEE203